MSTDPERVSSITHLLPTFLSSHLVLSQSGRERTPRSAAQAGMLFVVRGDGHWLQTVGAGEPLAPFSSASVMSHWDSFPSTLGCGFQGCCAYLHSADRSGKRAGNRSGRLCTILPTFHGLGLSSLAVSACRKKPEIMG